jgi:hypothetical protein
LIDILYTASGPKSIVIVKRKNDQRRQKEIDASLPLLQAALAHTLGLVHIGSVVGGLQRVAGGGQGLQVCAVLLLGLY